MIFQNNFVVFTKNKVMKRSNLLSGALILSVGGVLAKIFSAIYRIAITRILGGVGIGIYQLIFPVYSLCVVLTTSGLPLAISKVVAKHEGKNVIKKCLTFVCLFALVLSVLLFVSSGALAKLQGEQNIAICYAILAPSIIVVSASSVFKGYFQGRRQFVPSALSNIIEQFIKFVVGLVLTLLLIKQSLVLAIIGAVVAIDISEIVSFFVLVCFYRKKKDCNASTLSIKALLKDILPIMVTNVILPLAMFVDSLIVVNLLAPNFSKKTALAMYGIETGAVGSLVNLPTIFSFAIASVLMPLMSGKGNNFNKTNTLSVAVKIVLIITVPCTICFVFIPNRIIDVLYGGRFVFDQFDGMALAYKLLVISSFGIVFLTLNQLFSSALQAQEKRMATIRNLLIAVGVKFAFEIVFLQTKEINIFALTLGNILCYALSMVLNLISLKKCIKIRLDFAFLGKLLLCNVLMFLTLLGTLYADTSIWVTLIGLTLAGTVYLGSLFLTKIFVRRELAMIKYKVR